VKEIKRSLIPQTNKGLMFEKALALSELDPMVPSFLPSNTPSPTMTNSSSFNESKFMIQEMTLLTFLLDTTKDKKLTSYTNQQCIQQLTATTKIMSTTMTAAMVKIFIIFQYFSILLLH
jgi:hypothetical protein